MSYEAVGGAVRGLVVMACVGAVATAIAILYAACWIIAHVRVVIQ